MIDFCSFYEKFNEEKVNMRRCSDAGAIDNVESQMRNTHKCLECKKKFKAFKPGCPICGPGATVEPLKSVIDPFLCAKGID